MKTQKTSKTNNAKPTEADWAVGLAICDNAVREGRLTTPVPYEVIAAAVGCSLQAVHQFSERTVEKMRKKLRPLHKELA